MLSLPVHLKDLQGEVCGITNQEISSLVSLQNRRPFALAIIECADHPNRYFDARELTKKFDVRKEIADPITRETSIKVYYLWNLTVRNIFTEFGRIEAQEGKLPRDVNLGYFSEISNACQEPDIAKRIHAQIRTALRHINPEQDRQKEILDKLIALIYDEITTEAINLKYVHMSDYKKSLQELYKQTQDSRLAACLCLDEIETSFIDEEVDSILQEDPDNVLALTIKGLWLTREDCFVERKTQRAQECFERAVYLRNDNLQAWKNLLELSMDRARILITQHLLKEPDNPILMALSAQIILKSSKEISKDDLSKAKELLQKALKIDSRCLVAYFILANILGLNTSSRNEQDQAIQYLHKIIEIDPRNDRAYQRLGDCFTYGLFGVQVDDKQAYQYYEKAFECNPHSSSCEALGRLLLYGNGVKSDPPKALFFLEKALNVSTNIFAIHTLLGVIFYDGVGELKNNFTRAYGHFQKVIASEPNCKISHGYLGLLLINGFKDQPINQKKAYEHFVKASELHTKDFRVYYELGELLRTGGVDVPQDLIKAEQYLLKALGLFSDAPLVHRSLGLLYRTRTPAVVQNLVLPDIAKACIHLRKYCSLSQDQVSANYYYNLLLEEEWCDFPKEELCYLYAIASDCLQKDPKSSAALAYYGELHRIGIGNFLDKNPSKAHEFFLKSLAVDENNMIALCRIGALLIEGGEGVQVDLKKASDYLKQALVLYPNNPYAISKLKIVQERLQ